MTSCEIRLKAAEILTTFGLCKGDLHSDGRYCLLGALLKARDLPMENIHASGERGGYLALESDPDLQHVLRSMELTIDEAWKFSDRTVYSLGLDRALPIIVEKLQKGCHASL